MSTTEKNVSRRDFVRRVGLLGAVGLGGSTVLAACGGSEGNAGQSGGATGGASGGSGNTRTVEITPVGNEMKYEKTAFAVQPGEQIEIVLDNTATSPSMQHNVVLLNTSDDAAVKRVGEAGMRAGADAEYIPEDDAILAHTAMAQPGETVRTTFTAPSEPGKYAYLCTFPGHWSTMQGTMTVEGSAA